MIRTLFALDGALVRGALALVLGTQDAIDEEAELDRSEQIGPAMWSQRPDVAIVDLDLYGAGRPPERQAPPGHRCPVLVLADPRRSHALREALRAPGRTVGFLGHHVAPQRVVDAVRRLFRGELVVDAELVAAALTRRNPLTGREVEVLTVAAEGCPVVEIAAKLALSPGTVRNHLSRIAGKAGARTRIEAVRIARDAGWI